MANNLARIEITMLTEDAELLKRYAERHGTKVSEVVRLACYQAIPVLKRAKEEREERTYREVVERQKLREWNSGTDAK